MHPATYGERIRTPPRPRRWLGLTLVLVAFLAAAGCSPSTPTPVTVMTRNLYLGGDINRPVRATAGKSGTEALVALGQANHELRSIVGRTDFAARSPLLAAEITSARPDLVGLQEVALWRHGPLQLDQLGVPNATEVDQDFLALLLADLERAGVAYEVVAEQQESDVEAPSFTGRPLDGTAQDATDVRLTLRDVILRRVDSGLRVTGGGSGSYAARLDLSLGGLPYPIVRGFAWVDVRGTDGTFRFVTTHLESASADVAARQAAELVAGPAAGSDPAIVVCDCNSDPAGDSAAAADRIRDDGGLTDLWLAPGADRGPGATFGTGELADDADATGFTRRLDLVFARGADLAVLDARLTGNQVADRDPSTGLWPSDHAGVVVRLQL